MRLLLFIALAAALAVGCSKPDATSGTTGAAPNGTSTTGTGTTGSTAAATGKYAEVQAIFTTNCVKCHGGGPRTKAGIALTSYDGVMKGGSEGAIVKASDAAGSKIVMALHGKSAKQMPPPPATLSAADIATVEGWITAGAKNG